MVFRMALVFERYTPSEAAEITGVSATNQRNLRRHGYLTGGPGHARFSLAELAHLMVFGSLSEQGIGPKVAAGFATTAGRGIFLNALEAPVYDQVSQGVAMERCEMPDREEIRERLVGTGLDLDQPDTSRLMHELAARQWLVEQAKAALGVRGESAPYMFVLWANGHPEFFYGEDDPWSDAMFNHPAWQGPIIVLSMGGMAHLLASRLPRPAIRWEAE